MYEQSATSAGTTTLLALSRERERERWKWAAGWRKLLLFLFKSVHFWSLQAGHLLCISTAQHTNVCVATQHRLVFDWFSRCSIDYLAWNLNSYDMLTDSKEVGFSLATSHASLKVSDTIWPQMVVKLERNASWMTGNHYYVRRTSYISTSSWLQSWRVCETLRLYICVKYG